MALIERLGKIKTLNSDEAKEFLSAALPTAGHWIMPLIAPTAQLPTTVPFALALAVLRDATDLADNELFDVLCQISSWRRNSFPDVNVEAMEDRCVLCVDLAFVLESFVGIRHGMLKWVVTSRRPTVEDILSVASEQLHFDSILLWGEGRFLTYHEPFDDDVSSEMNEETPQWSQEACKALLATIAASLNPVALEHVWRSVERFPDSHADGLPCAVHWIEEFAAACDQCKQVDPLTLSYVSGEVSNYFDMKHWATLKSSDNGDAISMVGDSFARNGSLFAEQHQPRPGGRGVDPSAGSSSILVVAESIGDGQTGGSMHRSAPSPKNLDEGLPVILPQVSRSSIKKETDKSTRRGGEPSSSKYRVEEESNETVEKEKGGCGCCLVM